MTIDPAAVNALVPAELKASFVFEEKTIEEERGKTLYTTEDVDARRQDEDVRQASPAE